MNFYATCSEDFTVSSGAVICSGTFASISEPELPGLIPELTLEDSALLVGACLTLWAGAWVMREIVRFILNR
jgi:hypothetical protein